MKIIRDTAQMQSHSDSLRAKNKTISFVPTMGYFHEGHLSLMKIGRELGDELVVSIFVNPTQFGPDEDLEAYPRDMERDMKLLAEIPADIIYIPNVEQMYPPHYETYVRVEKTSEPLCGESRPIHFRGVATVCAKLFNAVKPHCAVFGKKDFQQILVIEKMVRDLNFDIEIVHGETYREPDGLAMSSRNVYMTQEERKQAPVIYKCLKEAEKMVTQGERDSGTILAKIREKLDNVSLGKIDYIEIRSLPELEEVEGGLNGPTLLAMAVQFGKSRLIDNIVLLDA